LLSILAGNEKTHCGISNQKFPIF
jgi:hypothetical protein